MPTYAYSCAPCGDFTVVRPMSQSGAPSCPTCGAAARRRFGAPALHTLGAGVRTAHAASERSADSPQIVTSVPGRSPRATRTTFDPRHARLPRP